MGTGATYTIALNEQRMEDGIRRPIGEWLRQVARPSDRVLLEPLGYIGYYSGLHMLDTVGLVNPAAIDQEDLRGSEMGVCPPPIIYMKLASSPY